MTHKNIPDFEEKDYAALLNRPKIQFPVEANLQQLIGKKVMITGAGGSIGTAVSLAICEADIAALYLLDHSEFALYSLKTSLHTCYSDKLIIFLLTDITDDRRMQSLISTLKPDIILHIAACKHVTITESNPYEAIKTNIFGPKTLADLAVKYQVAKFIFISTDKAVEPAGIMGATKRVAELYIQYLAACCSGKTSFAITRFGNVIGSSGSLSTILEEKIRRRDPVTITNPLATRYFMLPGEAAQLVIHAAANAANGQILVANMGDAVPIMDIAERLIRLHNLIPFEDIPFHYSNLRPGEKLYESLLNADENVISEPDSPALIVTAEPISEHSIFSIINALEAALHSGNDATMAATLQLSITSLPKATLSGARNR